METVLFSYPLLTCAVGLVLGLIPAAIASNKGHNFLGWWVFGALLFIVALPVALLIAPAEEHNKLLGSTRKCPYCAESVKRDAVVCRFCGRDFPSLGSDEAIISDAELKNLTYRQRRVLDEYGYFLSREDAETVGQMLGNFTSKEKITDFVMQNGKRAT